MKVTFTDKQEINYIQSLIEKDVIQIQEKLTKRKKILRTIFFDKELGDFHS